MFYREKEDTAKKELDAIYKNAVKEDGELFKVLKKSMQDKLGEDVSKDKWNTYKMICENYGFVSFNLTVVSIVAAIVGILLTKIPVTVYIAAILYVVFIICWAIFMYEKERRYKYINYVLDSLNKK